MTPLPDPIIPTSPISHLRYEWLETLPSFNLGLLLTNEELRIATGLRLRCEIVTPTSCVLYETHIDSLVHPLHCRFSKCRLSRHHANNSIINRTLKSSNIPSTLEASDLSPDNQTRPNGSPETI
ncbi:unnamed protein product [Gordionus sp. m RMFG-2023]